MIIKYYKQQTLITFCLLSLLLSGCVSTVTKISNSSKIPINKGLPKTIPKPSREINRSESSPESSDTESEVSPLSDSDKSGKVIQPSLSTSQRSKDKPDSSTAIKLNLKNLGAPYARLILEMGTPAEQRSLLSAVKELKDPELLGYISGYHLSQENFEMARSWSTQVESSDYQLPFWQQGMLALQSRNRGAMQDLLDKGGENLPPTTRVEILRALGRDAEALNVAQDQLNLAPESADSDSLHSHVHSLAMKFATQLTPAWELRNLAHLMIRSSSIQMGKRFNDTTSGKVMFAHRYLTADNLQVNLQSFNSEYDTFLELTREFLRSTVSGQLGANVRNDQSIVYGRLGGSLLLGTDWLGRSEISINELSEETPALRALGVKDRLTFGISRDPAFRENLSFKVDLHRYYTRARDNLGEGIRAELVASHRVLSHNPSWQIRLQGSLEENSLANRLPSYLVMSGIVPTTATVTTLVPDKFGMIGVGTTLGQGASWGEIGRFSSFADAWAGYVWPVDDLGYNLQAGLATSFMSTDQLKIAGFYANTTGGRTANVYGGIKIQYLILF